MKEFEEFKVRETLVSRYIKMGSLRESPSKNFKMLPLGLNYFFLKRHVLKLKVNYDQKSKKGPKLKFDFYL